MKAVVTVFLFVCVLTSPGQDLWKTKAAQQACGPAGVSYVKGDGLEEHPVLPQVKPGKAFVYLIEVDGSFLGSCIGNCNGTTTKFGLDGQWKGAMWGNSFVFADVEPGDHHLCVNINTRSKKVQPILALRSLHAEPGKTYFYGVRMTTVGGSSGYYGVDLMPLDPDEAHMRLEAYPLSKSKPKP